MAEEKLPTPVPVRDISEIAIALDSYEDIFSDFDPRPYSNRELSDDFLKEVRRRYRESKKGKLEVRFILPEDMREAKAEATIKKRLKEYFEMRAGELKKETMHRKLTGVVYMMIGAALLLIQAFLLETQKESGIPFAYALGIILMPAGWFGMFMGIEKIVEEETRDRLAREMNEKLGKAEFIFLSQEGIGAEKKKVQTKLGE